jgi:hypothetical protein
MTTSPRPSSLGRSRAVWDPRSISFSTVCGVDVTFVIATLEPSLVGEEIHGYREELCFWCSRRRRTRLAARRVLTTTSELSRRNYRTKRMRTPIGMTDRSSARQQIRTKLDQVTAFVFD